VLEAAGLGYRFRHEIVGEVLRQSLSPALRRFIAERAELARAAPGQQRPRSTSGFDAAGLVVAVAALARTRRIPLSLALLLDFFTAASLLRLAGPPTWSSLAAAALTITIRQLASRGLRIAQRSDRLSIMHGRQRASTTRTHFRHR
jgi:hypothetical protein